MTHDDTRSGPEAGERDAGSEAGERDAGSEAGERDAGSGGALSYIIPV